MNWRKPLIHALLRASGSEVPRRIRNIADLCARPPHEIRRLQQQRLEQLLQFAWQHVPYYRDVLAHAGAVEADGTVRLERFPAVPFLTKDILRSEFERLKSNDLPARKWYRNSSGGSTGDPVTFLQDRHYWNGEIAATLFFFRMAGKEIGEPELKLWGSERDILEGTVGWKEKLQNRLYNRLLLNSFRMGEREMADYAARWNRFRPRVVWTYVDSAFEFARYVERKGLALHRPAAVIVTAGTLTDVVRRYVERSLGTKVLNQYGSREVGGIACECPKQHGLHIFEWKVMVEVVDGNGEPCPPGTEGELVITPLESLAMPLIRFRIGDRGILGVETPPCGFPFRVLQQVTGRVTDHFTRADGTLVHGEYFTHLFYFRPWVKRFQVVQTAVDRVECQIVEGEKRKEEDLRDIEEKIRHVMGQECRVKFVFVPEIPPSPSGKYLFTRSEITGSRAKAPPAETHTQP